ncbi:hypothetical protein BSR29_05645 [Boudabousia liubingyangii]|uniref:HAD-IB family hydrolase n=1 Tax=Boudabousia liubingyangii TaxID=1921764 RepID=A0A1Q5PLP0_9ACTO|nr:HAD-IB family hydrolase [Boudabousia liubingyangii]OKL47963.1 hypothetical protein BSR29_05645 [Boudabousia liubingyangii]
MNNKPSKSQIKRIFKRATVTPAPGKKAAAFFDIDQTLIKGASAFQVAKALYKRNFFGKRDIFFAARHALLYRLLGEDKRSINRVVQRGLDVMAGHSAEELEEIVDELYGKIFSHRIIPGTRAILDRHLELGHEVWLISATPTQVSETIARKMGATGSLGTRVKTDGHNRFLPELESGIMHLRGKAMAAVSLASRRDLDLKSSFAYGDSINDLPLLETVGNPCAINPEPLLRLVAIDNDWPIAQFTSRRFDLKKLVRRILQTTVGTLLLRSLRNHFTRWL